MAPFATYRLEVDWDNNGEWGDVPFPMSFPIDWSAGGLIASDRVRSISCTRGRDRASQLTGRSKAGNLKALLDNRSGDYSSFNTSSPLYGQILPGKPVRLSATSAAQSKVVIWQGYLRRITPVAHTGGDSTAILEAVGPLGQVNLDQVAVPMVTSQRTDQVIDDILDAAGWGTGSTYRSLDEGKTTITRYWADQTYTVTAMQEIESTEGGFLREGKAGQIIFDNRQHRLSGAAVTSQATFSDQAGATLPYTRLVQDDSLPNVFNIFEADVTTYTTGAVAVLWTLSETGASSPAIAAGVSRTFVARYPTSGSGQNAKGVGTWTTTAATTDMTASAAAGSGTELTGDIGISVSKNSETMDITLTNNGSVIAYITKLQARGTPITEDNPVTIKAENTASQTAFGKRTWPSKTKYIPTSQEAQDWADFNLGIYKDPAATMKLSFIANRDQTALDEMITRDLSQRITVRANGNANLGINTDFFVEAISHNISANRVHKVEYLISDAVQFSDFWILGTSTLGTNTRLSY